MKYLLGIDFGTTTTAISCTRISATFEPELIEIDNQRTTESVVRLTDGNEIEIVGLKAWEDIGDAPERTFYEFKLKVASKDPLQLPEGPGTARDVGVIFLRNLREKIERGLFGNSPLKEIDSNEGLKTVIGHPSGWSEAQRKATVSMAEEAGFPNVEGCEEPIGALYYHYHLGDLSLDKTQKVLVYDFGGGTSDVAIIATSGAEEPKVVATSGIGDLGGRNFDERIASAWEEKLLRETQKSDLSNRDRAMVRRHSRRLKEKLSIAVEGKGNSASETIPNLKCKGDSDTFSLDVATFETMNADSIDRFGEPLWDAMSGASLSPSDIDIVILTGGSGRFYFAREQLKQMFPKARILRSANPQEAVSKGLALYSKVLVCGRESIRKEPEVAVQKDAKAPSDKAKPVSHQGASHGTPDPYAEAKSEREKKARSKLMLWGGVAAAVILLGFFAFGGKDASVTTTAGSAASAPVKEPSKQEKSMVVLRDIEAVYKRLESAQNDRNISMIAAIQSDLNNINVSEGIPEVASARSALMAWASITLDFHRKHGVHPYSAKKLWDMPTSNEVDALKEQDFLKDMRSIDAYSIDNAKNCLLFYLDKSYLALGERSKYSPSKYSIHLDSFAIDGVELKKETNYYDGVGKYLDNPINGGLFSFVLQPINLTGLATAMLDEDEPDVKVVLALREGSSFIPVKMYPRDQDAYEDVLKASISDSFTWYASENQSFYIFLLDIDETQGELLAYREIPKNGTSGWLDIGSGCKVQMNVSVEAIK